MHKIAQSKASRIDVKYGTRALGCDERYAQSSEERGEQEGGQDKGGAYV